MSAELFVLISCSPGDLWSLSDFLFGSAYRNESVTRDFSILFLIMLFLFFFFIVNEQHGILTTRLFGFPSRLTNQGRKGWLYNMHVPVSLSCTSHYQWMIWHSMLGVLWMWVCTWGDEYTQGALGSQNLEGGRPDSGMRKVSLVRTQPTEACFLCDKHICF